jgi:negative regulator of flagellin synthesis FlgM
MKIGNSVESAAASVPTGRNAPADADKLTPAASGPAAASTQVELSSTAATLRSGSPTASADFDAEKVDRISQSISDGSFKVNPEAIADKLISNAQELLSKGQR